MKKYREKVRIRVIGLAMVTIGLGIASAILMLNRNLLPTVPEYMMGFQTGAFSALELLLVYNMMKSVASLKSEETLKRLFIGETDERKLLILQNPIFDTATAAVIGGVAISAGWISFLSILLRCCLSVIAALLLVSTAGMGGISRALRMLRVPRILVAQLLMTFRYIHVLGSEAGRMLLAYGLRAPGQKGIAYRQWGPFSGQWLLRSLGRADRLHSAMLCRGYTGEMPAAKGNAFTLVDLGYVLAWLAFFAAARLVNIPQEIGKLIMALGG